MPFDALLIHESRLKHLNALVSSLAQKNVTIYADEESYAVLSQNYPIGLLQKATEEDYGREYLSHKMLVSVVNSADRAFTQIQKYTSGHSEAIVAENQKIIDIFLATIDAAVLYVNASPSFTDGGEFGMGAEIGISTQNSMLAADGSVCLDDL